MERDQEPFGVVDSHLHLWDQSMLNYSWMVGKNLLHSFGPQEFSLQTQGLQIDGVVLVEAAADFCDGVTTSPLHLPPGQGIKEAKWFEQLARQNSNLPVKAVLFELLTYQRL
jgi:hypothetical protein